MEMSIILLDATWSRKTESNLSRGTTLFEIKGKASSRQNRSLWNFSPIDFAKIKTRDISNRIPGTGPYPTDVNAFTLVSAASLPLLSFSGALAANKQTNTHGDISY
ncbi:hypothetical protein PRIPAC_92051, partial [Pristionchus pacificus]|uniref:Uncharacterized protein n=1 Tax=Pristionchus pacificus TaxID=54126 RepID=A0A2A6BQJ2_PRIPA